ncbi:DUF6913 domain-containing protein [Flavobacterium sp. TSSA_36]|uniref:DUF6913 domain-containing protein n=1 Tax=Flavobacterium sp. TSSA_36 TaxID=3447669 RepID=UPI003F359465
MFFNYFKDFFLKKKLKNILLNTRKISLSNEVQSIGLLVDEVTFNQTNALTKALIANGFHEQNITVLAFKEAKHLNQPCEYSVFSWKSLSLDLQIQDPKVLDFIRFPFDVLLSYYDTQNSFLEWITHQSLAKFKVGFFTIDHRLNDLLINTQTINYNQFAQEFMRVLQSIKKN